MKTPFLLVSLAALLLSAFPTPCPADTAPPPVRKVTVIGTAIVKVAPDEMNWSVQVSINDSTLAQAKARHDASLTAALAYIKSLGDATKDLQTGGIRFDRNLYPGDDSFAKRNPFSCSTQFTFTLTDFDKYGPIADALSKLDGVQVQSVDYATSKEAELRREALKRALLDGHDKAGDLAAAADCYIDKPLSIDEQEAFNVRPEMMNATFGRSATGTPDAVAGQIEITAKVVVAYDLFYK
jgi:uncharacterized protein YggE